ncbi:MAG TPA: spermidine synthase [Candidatus Dormibacteraeota bacterium]|nr:spermidine synthase [Candidatus Dormibacteraeota bacterium]
MATETALAPTNVEAGEPRGTSGRPDRRLLPVGSARRLVVLSMLSLFVELALIRWTVANNVQLVSITNFVLLASFLGIGLGFLLARSKVDLFGLVPVWLSVLVGFVLVFAVRLVALSGPREFQSVGGRAPLPQWVSLPVIFVLVVAVMAGLGQGLAVTFSRFGSLDAYRWDIVGSIAGITAFSLLSLVGLPPLAWAAVLVVLLAVLLGRTGRWWQWLGIGVVLVVLAVESFSSYDHWSPYYKITAVPPPNTPGVLVVSGNNIPFQTLYPIQTLQRIESFYFFPYRHASRADLGNVLIIGAGTGNDVGVALSEGARHVDAVEIDPRLVALGRRYNPEHAYQNPRVTLHIDDGRAYVSNTHRRYNLILYALPDSLTALTGQAAPVGLENYLLTSQAIVAAKAHLAPGGTFVMYNYYQPFLLNRYATQLSDTFGSRPCVELGDPLSGRRQAVLTEASSGPTPDCSSPWGGKRVAPVSDDRPYPYLPTPSIPVLYLTVVGLVLAGSLLAVRVAGGPLRRMAPFTDLFCMGAAFMLLETKNVVQFALLFGTTWYVNSLVFAGVLLSIYAAVETARHLRLPPPWALYAALVVTLVIAWVVPQASLLSLPAVFRFLAATALAFGPVFVANLVFAQRFAGVASSTTAFGANLLGAIVGGALEYLSLVTGFRVLLIVVAALYGLAFLFGRRHLTAASPA